MRFLKGPKNPVHAVVFSPDGAGLASAHGDTMVRLWDANTGRERTGYPAGRSFCGYGLAFAPNGRSLAYAGGDLRVVDLDTGHVNVLDDAPIWGRRLSFSPDGRTLAVAGSSSTLLMGGCHLYLWDPKTGSPRIAGPDAADSTGGVAYSPDGKWLASGHLIPPPEGASAAAEYLVRVRDAASGEVACSFGGCRQPVTGLAWAPGGGVLAGIGGPYLRAWDVQERREVAERKPGTKHFQSLAFTPNGAYLFTVSNDQTVRVWKTAAWQEHTTFTWKIGRLLGVAVAPDGLRAAACGSNGQIVIWDLDL